MIGRSVRLGTCPRRAAFGAALAIADGPGRPVWRLRALHELGTIDMFDGWIRPACSRPAGGWRSARSARWPRWTSSWPRRPPAVGAGRGRPLRPGRARPSGGWGSTASGSWRCGSWPRASDAPRTRRGRRLCAQAGRGPGDAEARRVGPGPRMNALLDGDRAGAFPLARAWRSCPAASSQPIRPGMWPLLWRPG